jgi:hypothetical protein
MVLHLPVELAQLIRTWELLRFHSTLEKSSDEVEDVKDDRPSTPHPSDRPIGLVPSEDSSGERTRRGNITKTGNAHLRRVVVEAAWAYRHRPSVGAKLRKRQAHVSEEIKEISWKAQQRLHQRYRKLLAKGKNKGVVMTAVGRELLGFIWAIGIQAETAPKEPLRRAA